MTKRKQILYRNIIILAIGFVFLSGLAVCKLLEGDAEPFYGGVIGAGIFGCIAVWYISTQKRHSIADKMFYLGTFSFMGGSVINYALIYHFRHSFQIGLGITLELLLIVFAIVLWYLAQSDK